MPNKLVIKKVGMLWCIIYNSKVVEESHNWQTIKKDVWHILECSECQYGIRTL